VDDRRRLPDRRLEVDVRRRLEDLGADAEAERAVLEARLQELVRRFESAGALQSQLKRGSYKPPFLPPTMRAGFVVATTNLWSHE